MRVLLRISSRRSRAQTSVEILVILGVTLLALLVFFMLSQSETIDVNKKKIKTEAENSVSDIASAARDVYAQGVGARKQVFIKIPQAYEYTDSYIGSNAIKIRAGGSDYVETTDFDVRGSLPATSGNHWLWIVSEGNRVRIGQSMVETSQLSLNIIMGRESTKMEGFVLKSTWDQPLNVSIKPDWNNENVGLSLDWLGFPLNPLGSRGVAATFSSNRNATGFNSGNLEVFATDGSTNETFLIPITIEISGNKSITPNLLIMPGSLSIKVEPGVNRSQTFQVCARSALSSVEFSVSAGDAGEWIDELESLSSMGTESCQPKTVMIRVPSDAELGIHSGYIFASGSGAPRADASVYLSINVSSEVKGGNKPNISRLASYPDKIFSPEPITISALVEDTDNNTITRCLIRHENNGLFTMDAADGAYDEAKEVVSYTYFSGMDLGEHTVTVECEDQAGEKVSKSHTFRVMEEILFVKLGNNPTASEDEWMSWIRDHKSAEGLTWSMDEIKSAQLTSGEIDNNYYATIALASWNSGIKQELTEHISEGGYVVLLGEAVLHGSRELGISDKTGSTYSTDSINILTNDSYVTLPFFEGGLTIAEAPTQICSVNQHGGDVLAIWEEATLGANNRVMIWGAVNPDELNNLGANLSVRVFDNAIAQSTITPG